MKNWILTLSLGLLSFCATAQESDDKIETDRPDQTETPTLVPQHYFQAELGVTKLTDGNNYDVEHPTALLKYGLLKKLELRLEWTWRSQHIQQIPNSKTFNGSEPVEIGGKLHVLDAKGLIPKTSLLAHLGLPVLSSKSFRPPHLAPSFRFAMEHDLSKQWQLSYNLGAEWDGESTTPAWLYTLAPGVELGEKWYAFVEVFGFLHPHDLPEHSVDGGLAYTISNNTRVDLSGGMGLTQNAYDHFIALGFSFRLPTKK